MSHAPLIASLPSLAAGADAGAYHEPLPTWKYWILTLGVYGPALLVVTVLLVVAAWKVARHSPGYEAIRSFSVFLPVPLLIGMLGALHRAMDGCNQMSDPPHRPAFDDFVVPIAEGMIVLMTAIASLAPVYAILGWGWFVRIRKDQRAERPAPRSDSVDR